MEDMFRSATEDVLAHCAADMALFHKHVTPGHGVSPKRCFLSLCYITWLFIPTSQNCA